jgi:hypothetical protein
VSDGADAAPASALSVAVVAGLGVGVDAAGSVATASAVVGEAAVEEVAVDELDVDEAVDDEVVVASSSAESAPVLAVPPLLPALAAAPLCSAFGDGPDACPVALCK